MKYSPYLRQHSMKYIGHTIKTFRGPNNVKDKIRFYICVWQNRGENNISFNPLFFILFKRFHAFLLFFSIEKELLNCSEIVSYLHSYMKKSVFFALKYAFRISYVILRHSRACDVMYIIFASTIIVQ